ncbi:MAG: Fic family protein [Bacillota bacterium]|nr:Fic family protein [Bacillota bacterium]
MPITTKEASLKWGISDRRIRELCQEGKIAGAFLNGKTWYLPDEAKKPVDGRIKKSPSYLRKILSLKKELDGKRPLTQGELERLNEEFVVEYTYNSNAIEGNTLTLRETDLVLKGITIDKKPLKDHLEAINHKEAFDYLLMLVKENSPLSEKAILSLHSIVLADRREDSGIYRRVPVRIMGAAHIPPQPYKIEAKIQELLCWYQEDKGEDFLARLARFHIEFEAIHPFIDGNGRTGRLLVNLELMKLGYPPIDIKYADRTAYYEAFDAYHVKNDLKPMYNLFARYLYERLSGYLEILG